MIKKNLKLAISPSLVLLIGLALSACGGSGKTIVTTDNSADYKSANSLPPLKKSKQDRPVKQENVVAGQFKPARGAQPSKAGEVDSLTTPNTSSNSETAQASNSALGAEKSESSDETVVESMPETFEQTRDSSSPAGLSSNVIAGESNNSRLKIDAEFSPAWAYLSTKLQRSDVTIFSRNKAAGRFSIGCGNMESSVVIKKGGWSFLKKSKQKRSEYCSLSVVERRGSTLVFVLNRDGTEVSDEFSEPLFARILNN